MGLFGRVCVRAGIAVGWLIIAALSNPSTPALAAATAKAAKSTKCATDVELDAVGSRVLETELLVAALSCSQAPQYNAFMEKFRTEQNARARILKAMFNRLYGKGGQRELDAFVTRLGNDSALRSLELQLAYCQATWDIFQEGDRVSEADYAQLTHSPWISERHPFKPCNR